MISIVLEKLQLKIIKWLTERINLGLLAGLFKSKRYEIRRTPTNEWGSGFDKEVRRRTECQAMDCLIDKYAYTSFKITTDSTRVQIFILEIGGEKVIVTKRELPVYERKWCVILKGAEERGVLALPISFSLKAEVEYQGYTLDDIVSYHEEIEILDRIEEYYVFGDIESFKDEFERIEFSGFDPSFYFQFGKGEIPSFGRIVRNTNNTTLPLGLFKRFKERLDYLGDSFTILIRVDEDIVLYREELYRLFDDHLPLRHEGQSKWAWFHVCKHGMEKVINVQNSQTLIKDKTNETKPLKTFILAGNEEEFDRLKKNTKIQATFRLDILTKEELLDDIKELEIFNKDLDYLNRILLNKPVRVMTYKALRSLLIDDNYEEIENLLREEYKNAK